MLKMEVSKKSLAIKKYLKYYISNESNISQFIKLNYILPS